LLNVLNVFGRLGPEPRQADLLEILPIPETFSCQNQKSWGMLFL